MNTSRSKTISEVVGFIEKNQIASKVDYILQVIKEDGDKAEVIYRLAISCAENNRLNQALTLFKCLQFNNKNDERIPYNLGLIQAMLGDHQGALKAYDVALELKPDDVETLINKASSCNDIKNYALALEILERAIQIRADIPEAWSNKGIALSNLNLYGRSVSAYDEAIKLNPNYFEVWSNKSIPLYKLKKFEEAINACDKALTLKPDYAEAWCNKGVILNELKFYDEAITHYDKALSLQPDYLEALFNKCIILYACRRHEEAIACYDKALTLRPDYAEAWCNKGVSLHELKSFHEAIACYDTALSLQPEYADAWCNRGVSMNECGRYPESIRDYEKAISLESNGNWTDGDLLHVKMKICNWFGFEETINSLITKVHAKQRILSPFFSLSLIDDPLLHKQCSEIYVQEKYPANFILGPITKNTKSEKIRIGYFSSDFKEHPVSILMAELFELHDKKRFEIIAFSSGPDDKSFLRNRIRNCFDRFIDISAMSDRGVAELARNLDIDIAVDLGGFTTDRRTGVFSYRAAPIQVNYLGYPGTMGADYYDYVIADKTLIPPDSQSCYSEKIVYLPNTYQVNDRKREISARQFTRQELGLPENGFVFCCFNNNFKILPATFDGWMRILKAVEGSVLWLLQDNSWAVENLKKEAQKQGVDAERLVFADRMLPSEHLSRHRQADLFLDTLPYNAHTTTSDALWTGLPVLTLMGRSFASRVAASLLNAIGLPELITSTQDAYEALAIELATNSKKLVDIKLKLANNRLTTPLFDTPLFTKNLEAAYIKMYERYQAGLETEHLVINYNFDMTQNNLRIK